MLSAFRHPELDAAGRTISALDWAIDDAWALQVLRQMAWCNTSAQGGSARKGRWRRCYPRPAAEARYLEGLRLCQRTP